MSTPTQSPRAGRQVVLPGQAAAPEGPVDLTMMFVMHHAFRRDLAHFAAAARQTPVEERETWRALSDRWELFAQILHHHHSGEDAGVWPVLLARAAEQDRTTLEAMEAEHAEIDPLLAGCADGLARLADGGDDDVRSALAVRMTATRECLGRHLAHEETDALAIVQRLLTQAEWEAIGEEHFDRPVRVGMLFRLVPWAAHELPDAVRRPILASAGLGFRVLWRLSRPGFERRERKAFRHA